MAGRGRRTLSPEDRRLWRELAATTTPLHPAEPAVPALPDDPAEPSRPALPRSVAPRPPEPPRITVDLAPDPHVALARANPHMDRRRFDKLRRGRLEPEDRIDLHGMTAERAHAALTGFILAAHARDLRLVLVITGKGRAADATPGPGHPGILRHSLPHWLAGPLLSPRILQVAPAHRRHGGAGAFYVYLRRRR